MSGSPAAADWQPSTTRQALAARALVNRLIREFFEQRQVMEVETPVLCSHAVTDPHLHSATVTLPGVTKPLFLHTSPEFAMKRLLAAGSGDIYQICHVFRGEERSSRHNPEFTLLEWYRCGFDMWALAQEACALTCLLLGLPPATAAEAVSFVEAFQTHAGFDPLTIALEELRAAAQRAGLTADTARRCTRDDLLDWMIATTIGPRLGTAAPCILHSYPASQAALARLDPSDDRVARRFEIYFRGLELANGFEELAIAREQQQRFEADQQQRRTRGLPAVTFDPRLLQALEHGLPPVAGVALGLDRVLMLRLQAQHIGEVIAFPIERA